MVRVLRREVGGVDEHLPSPLASLHDSFPLPSDDGAEFINEPVESAWWIKRPRVLGEESKAVCE